jgi:hypothetical protein
LFLFKITTINGAKVLDEKKDIEIPQGIAHSVDRVMFPLPVGDIVQTLQSDRERRFTSFLRALFSSGLAETLQGKYFLCGSSTTMNNGDCRTMIPLYSNYKKIRVVLSSALEVLSKFTVSSPSAHERSTGVRSGRFEVAHHILVKLYQFLIGKLTRICNRGQPRFWYRLILNGWTVVDLLSKDPS